MPRISTSPSSAAHDRHFRKQPSRTSSCLGNTSRGIIWLLTGLSSSIVAAIAITVIGVWVFPQFSDTFTAFSLCGNNLPLLTRLTTRFYSAIWFAQVLVALIRLLWPSKARRRVAAGVFGLFTLLGGVPLVFLSAYLPIFQLSSAL